MVGGFAGRDKDRLGALPASCAGNGATGLEPDQSTGAQRASSGVIEVTYGRDATPSDEVDRRRVVFRFRGCHVIRRLRLPVGLALPLLLVAVLATIVVVAGCTAKNKSAIPANQRQEYERPEKVESAVEAKKLLVEGNERFVSGETAEKDLSGTRRDELTEGQKPFAVIVCCADSRVPPEHVFDQGLGDIFVVRVAGNVADPVAIGSVEYAVEHLEVPLVVVLGHEKCGAVSATVEGGEAPGSIGAIVEKISPSVEKARGGNLEDEELIEKAVELNVEQTMRDLKASPIVTERRGKEELSILGATYELGSGEVKWL